MWKILDDKRGLSLIELVVTLSILIILSSLILPSAQMASKRSKEIELRRNLREIRGAIDEYKKIYDRGVDEKKIIQSVNKPGGYPETLEVLVEGDDLNGYLGYKKKFLRRIPADPFYKPEGDEPGWGMRSHDDEPDSTNWGGEDVFDVYSLSDGTAIDGTKYKDW
uniref:General secretion pathway protein GspG n=1 Tax=Geobacter sp. (strain M21) TaxID=443144 RepID=C6E2R7_GEOSM